LAVTALIMFGLARLKRMTAEQSDSEPLHAEAGMTFLDGCLGASILSALVLNAWLGWWWTDATAALLVGGFAVNEGIDHWRESAPHLEELGAPGQADTRDR
jgi:divalent metal cation (Fe/Co/Zn/Cd) transporter